MISEYGQYVYADVNPDNLYSELVQVLNIAQTLKGRWYHMPPSTHFDLTSFTWTNRSSVDL
jgi:hypothetical protein